MRLDERANNALRPVSIALDYIEWAEGSALITCGKTKVLCTATIQPDVPSWLAGRGRGWVTGEYAMLPRATSERTKRETHGLSGRTQEIRRLIGRSLRASVDLKALGGRMVIIDCDVLQADGGTRTASITGGYVALCRALQPLINTGQIDKSVLLASVAAVSVGLIDGEPLLDLCYQEDSRAEVDFNVVMNAKHQFIEVQGTAEGRPFARQELDRFLALAQDGIDELLQLQQHALSNPT